MKIRCETEILAFPYAHILNKLLLYYENAEGDMMNSNLSHLYIHRPLS